MAHYPSNGESVWNNTVDSVQYPNLNHDFTIDVAVVGAGIAGLTTAYLLKQLGMKVAVFEKYRIGDSISGYTTAKVTSQHGITYTELIKKFGKVDARLYGEANEAAIRMIEDIIKTEKIDCDWRREDNYVYTNRPQEVITLKREAEDAASLGLPASYVEKIPLDIPVRGAVRFKNQATFHIVKYLQGLAQAIEGDGCYVFEKTKVTRVKDGEDIATFSVPGGKVTARHVVLATNIPAPLKDHAAYAFLAYPTRSYLIVGKTDKYVPGMYINTGNPTRSVLHTKLDNEQWLLVGGEGHFPGMTGPAKGRYEKLEKYAKKYLGMKQVSYRWTTWDYTAYDHMPLVGKLYLSSDRVYTATGFRKWGMTNGTVAAMILADLLSGVDNPWADTFRSSRLSALKSLPEGLTKGIGFRK